MRPLIDRLPPLAEAYLSDLARALGATEERDEIVQSVREHICDALEDLDRAERLQALPLILEQLGPTERLAEASAIEPATPAATGTISAAIAAIGVAFLSAVLTVAAPLVGAVLAVGSIVFSVALGRRERRLERHAWAYALALTVAGATLVYAAGLTLFVLSFHDPVVVPTLAPGVPE